jgi:DNA polymerase III subunit gamma/tau
MSLYLTYRPSDFTSLVGQDFIKTTLARAIADHKIVGAYLFTGPRGTGKTSTARIFAKALNCLNPSEGNPCLSCEVCKEFQSGGLIDIIEIDAASHTGVDNIREIIEKAQFQPTRTKYKVYIIDEVHMLSKWAFNALLKILEEPPAHVKFILATTEIHKVPETILSRCQRYDFKNIWNDDMSARLRYIAKTEHIELEEAALQYIVKQAQGGLRNAISLLEQLSRDGKVDYATIESTLGIGTLQEIESFLTKLLSQDTSVLDDFDTLKKQGKNLKLFFRDILFLGRDRAITLLQSGGNVRDILTVLEVLQEAGIKAKNSFDESTSYLLAVLKLLQGAEQLSVSQVAKKEIPEIKKPISEPPVSIPVVSTLPLAAEKTLSNQEVEDIFGNSKNTENPTSSQLSSPLIDSETLATTVKRLGAKAALTMSVRGAHISQDGGNYTIQSQSKIAKTTFEMSENQALLRQAFEHILWKEIELKII